MCYMTVKIFNRLSFLLLLLLISCRQGTATGQEIDSAGVVEPSLSIIRFDKLLYDWLKQPDQPLPDQITVDCRDFLNLYSEYIIEVGSPDSVSFSNKLQKRFSDSALFQLYADAEQKYDSIADIESELSKAFKEFRFYFPQIQIPRIYMHVSGLNQSVISGENIVSLSIDKYLGENYPLYSRYYNARQRKNMTAERIVPDYLTGFLYSEFSFDGSDSRLLDNMIYRGKIAYALQALLPEISNASLLGFTEDEYDLCLKNEKDIWRFILKNDHLYTNDYLTISKYMSDAAHSAFFTDEYPAQIGAFIGWRIVSQFMEKNKKVTLPDLMDITDARQILAKSKYK